jgi:hypothetical protein
MRLAVEVVCPECAHPSRLEYIWLGTTARCEACGRVGIRKVPVGGKYPVTQWEVTFENFRQLIREASYRTMIEPLLQRFGYRLRGVGEATAVFDQAGTALDELSVHLDIQNSESRQYELYQTAMSLWR